MMLAELKRSGIAWQGNVPASWNRAKLFRISKSISSGGTPSSSSQDLYGGDIPWIQSGDLTDGLVETTAKTITEEALEKSAAKIFPKGTLLIALYGATIGKLGVMGMDAATNQACCAIQLTNEIIPRFGYYLLHGMRRYLLSLAYGGSQPNISQQLVKQQYFFYPDRCEQQRIADYLDASCEAI